MFCAPNLPGPITGAQKIVVFRGFRAGGGVLVLFLFLFLLQFCIGVFWEIYFFAPPGISMPVSFSAASGPETAESTSAEMKSLFDLQPGQAIAGFSFLCSFLSNRKWHIGLLVLLTTFVPPF